MRSRNQGREEVLIRDMKSEEIKEVSQIWLSANLEAHDFIPASYWKGNLDLVREELPLAKVRVYEEEGKILGFLGRNGEEIEGIFVRKECRSRGNRQGASGGCEAIPGEAAPACLPEEPAGRDVLPQGRILDLFRRD